MSSVHPFKMRGRGDGWLVSRGEELGNRPRPLAQVARRDVIGIRNTSYTDCTGINCTSIWSVVAVGGVEGRGILGKRESIRNDDLRTLFFVLLFISRREDKEEKIATERTPFYFFIFYNAHLINDDQQE
jgi:hypothetical protein